MRAKHAFDWIQMNPENELSYPLMQGLGSFDSMGSWYQFDSTGFCFVIYRLLRIRSRCFASRWSYWISFCNHNVSLRSFKNPHFSLLRLIAGKKDLMIRTNICLEQPFQAGVVMRSPFTLCLSTQDFLPPNRRHVGSIEVVRFDSASSWQTEVYLAWSNPSPLKGLQRYPARRRSCWRLSTFRSTEV